MFPVRSLFAPGNLESNNNHFAHLIPFPDEMCLYLGLPVRIFFKYEVDMDKESISGLVKDQWTSVKFPHQVARARLCEDDKVEVEGEDVFSRKQVTLKVPLKDWCGFLHIDGYIQDIMPDTPVDVREWFISGIGDESWKATINLRD